MPSTTVKMTLMCVTGSVAGKDAVASLFCLEACTMPPITMKSSTHGGFSSGPLDPVSEVHDGFNNMDLPSTSGERPSTVSNSL